MPPQLYVSCLIGLLLLIGSIAALRCPERGSSTPGRELVCYTRSHDVTRLENAICRCTTLVHQGHDLQSLDSSELKSLRDAAKEANPDIKIVMSISDEQGILKSTKTTRQDAATYLSDVLQEVDGVELNVTAGSKDRLISFVKGLKDELANKSIDKMILLSLPTKPEDLAKQFELKELAKYVDVFTVATHYLRDSDEAYRSFHPSRLIGLFDMLNTDSLVDLISGMGAPKHKILISAPTSAYQFTLRKAEENTPRSPTIEEQPIAMDRKKLCDAMNDGEWTVERDEDLTAPYAFENTSWIAFEDETSLKIKGKYVMLRELAGLGLRDIENDTTNDCGASVSQIIHKSFTDLRRKTREALLSSLEKDLKGSEISYPRHVRSSDFRIVRVVDTEGKIQTIRENTRTAFTCTRQGYFVHPRSCNRFYRCVKFNQGVDDYSVFEFDCPAGLAFDERSEVCTWPGSLPRGSACPGSSEIEPVPRGRFRCPSHPGFYADPGNCRWFFACYDLGGPEMVPYEFRCPFGLVFDEHRLVCEWPWKVPNCNGHGHGDDHSVYNYGGTYGGQGGDVPQGGIVGVGGFVGQGGFAGGSYDDQSGQGVGFEAGAYDGQNYNTAGTAGAYNGQAFNAAGAVGAQGDYNGQAQSGANYDGQSYNADYDGQKYNGAGAGFDGQTHNAEGFAGANAGYDSQSHSAGGFAGADGGYNGQTYNTGGSAGANAGYDGQGYNAGNFGGSGTGYNGQTYNAEGTGGADYDGQNYNAGGASYGAGYNGQSYDAIGAGGASADYDGQTFNSDGTVYNQQSYNPAGSVGINGPRPFAPSIYNQPSYQTTISSVNHDGDGYNNQAYDGYTQTQVGKGKDYNNQAYDGDTQSHEDVGKDYNNQNYDGDTQLHEDIGKNYNNQHFDDDTQTHIGVGRPFTVHPAGYGGQSIVTSTVNYEDRGGVTPTYNYAGQGSTYANAGGKATQYNAGTIGTTADVNNIAGDTRVPTGFTTGTVINYAGVGSTTGYAGVTTGYANNGYTSGSTTGYGAGTTSEYANRGTAGYAAGGTTEYKAGAAGATTGLNNLAGQTGNAKAGSTYGYAQNTYGSTGLFGGLGSTANVQTNTFGSDVSQYTGGIGTTVYNTSYNPNVGYPSSTILPFREKENTDDYQGTKPVNSVGLSTSENFGTQYTNQAENSVVNNGKTTGYASYGRTQTAQNYNPSTAFYAGDTKTTAGLGKFGSTVAPNYNTGAGATNAFDNNSPLIGSSLVPNNDITRYNENTGSYGGSTFYNRETTLYQNPYTATGYAKTSSPNGVTPSTVIQDYNKQGTRIPGVVPLTDSRPVVELDNSGIFGTNNVVSTPGAKTATTQYSGYRTNDIQDYRTSSYTGIPNSFIINAGNGENEQSTILKAGEQTTTEVYTRGGFTKTGPTKTGITTAQVGGTGSYVIGTGTPRQRPNPQYIGEHAFATNTGSAGTATNFGTAGTTTNIFAANQNTNLATSGIKGSKGGFGTTGLGGVTTTIDYGKLNTVTSTNTNFAGYSYSKPSVPFETNSPSSRPDTIQTPYSGSTTPSSIQNQNSVIIDGTNAGYSTTISPVGYTTSQADNFRTTIYQATGLTQKVSSVRPVIDTGSRTIISSTKIPAIVTTQRPIYENNVVSTTPQTYLDVGVSFDQGNYDYTSFAQGSTGNSDYSDITSNFDQGIFGQKIGGQTRFTNNYPQPSTNSPLISQNNELIKPTEENYNAFTQTGKEFTAQTKSVRINQGNGYRSRVNIPSQVYLPSTTLAPVIGVTFRRPIVAAEFNQNRNSDFVYRGSNTRLLNNQVSPTDKPQSTTSGVLINQASYDYNSQRYNNGQVLRNQAESGVTPQAAAETYFNNQAAGTFASRENNRLSSNQEIQNSLNIQNQGFSRGTTSSIDQAKDFNGKTLVGSQVVTSFGFNNDAVRQNSVNRGNLKIETVFNSGGRAHQSTTLAPEITTYTGDYGRSRLQSSVRNQNKKVIVKLSDLHPLILGKLGAECTCRADPFAVFRGQNRQSLPINSENRGPVDLANYDESDIYVDVDSDKENLSEIDFARNIPSNRLIKTSSTGSNELNSKGQLSSSTYLPPTGRPSFTYLPPKSSTAYLLSSTPASFSSVLRSNQASSNTKPPNHPPLLIRVEDSYANSRAGKALFGGSANNFGNQDGTIDPYGSGALRDSGETLRGELDCARPGLFRHPQHCNKFYACHWDNWKKKYTLHVFNCPVYLAFDSSAGACNYPSKGPACQDNKLLT